MWHFVQVLAAVMQLQLNKDMLIVCFNITGQFVFLKVPVNDFVTSLPLIFALNVKMFCDAEMVELDFTGKNCITEQYFLPLYSIINFFPNVKSTVALLLSSFVFINPSTIFRPGS